MTDRARNCVSCKKAINETTVSGQEGIWVHTESKVSACYPDNPVAFPEVGLVLGVRPVYLDAAEVVSLAADLQEDFRPKIGPRLTAALAVIAASNQLLELLHEQQEIDDKRDAEEWAEFLKENPDFNDEDKV
jgi:hypothetical protein